MQIEGLTISKKFCDLTHAKSSQKIKIQICNSEICPIFFIIQQDFQHLQLKASMQLSKVNIGGTVSDYVWASSGDFFNPPVHKLIELVIFFKTNDVDTNFSAEDFAEKGEILASQDWH